MDALCTGKATLNSGPNSMVWFEETFHLAKSSNSDSKSNVIASIENAIEIPDTDDAVL